jgi:hypothetical protein
MAKKKQAQQQQQEPGIIKPDFSELIEKMRQEKQQAPKAKAGKERPKPEPEVITVTPEDIDSPSKHEGSERERERQERLERARELVQEEKQEREKERDSGSEGGVLEPIDYPRGGPQTTPDVERQLLVLADGVRHGLSVPEIVKKHGIGRSTVQRPRHRCWHIPRQAEGASRSPF